MTSHPIRSGLPPQVKPSDHEGLFAGGQNMVSKLERERIRLRKVYGSLYSPYYADPYPGGFGCFYCAEPAGTRDHCPPLTWYETRTMENWKRDGVEMVTLPACLDCNRTLGERALFTPLLRVQYVVKKLEQKYERKSTLWPEDEIAEMSPEFQRTIRARVGQLRVLLDRLRAAQWREMVEEAVERYREG